MGVRQNPAWVTYEQSQQQSPGPLRIAAIAGSGTNSWFVDQNSTPRLVVLEQAWALPWNAGRWNGSGGGTYQQDMTSYFSARASQGFTAWYGVAWGNGNIDTTAQGGGAAWDGTFALVVDGSPGAIFNYSTNVTALNNPFWQRLDYMFTTAASHGITCFLNLGLSYDFTGSHSVQGTWQYATNTQLHQFGALLAARYPQSSYPNVWWFFGDDDTGGNDAGYSAMLAGIQSAGDTRGLISSEQVHETNSHVRFDTGAVYVPGGFAITNDTYNWVYTYSPPYIGVEDSYTETGTTPITVLYGDGPYYGDVNTSSADYTARRFTWWALASGSRGFNSTSGPSQNPNAGDVWTWNSSAVGALTTDPNGNWIPHQLPAVITYFTSLANWWKLVPDTGSALVTSGRGTRATAPAPDTTLNYGDSDDYVAASRVSDGSLAVIYCAQHFSITINQTLMQSGYSATWVDPWNTATTATATGGSYSSTALGNNSAGNPDWALVLHKP